VTVIFQWENGNVHATGESSAEIRNESYGWLQQWAFPDTPVSLNRGIFMLRQKKLLTCTVVFFAIFAFFISGCSNKEQKIKLTGEQIRVIAKESYIYAFPMLEFYRIEYLNGVLLQQFNKMVHFRDLKTCNDKAVVRPNNDTLYTIIHLDLRAEPYILEVPAVTDRYYSFQLIDVYTHVPYFIGTRATGTGPGKYLIAGPHWPGRTVAGVAQIFRVESDFIMVLGRTAVNGTNDLTAAHAVQDQYRLYPLSDDSQETPGAISELLFPVVDATYPLNFSLTTWSIPGIPPLNATLPGMPPFKEMSADFIAYLNFQLGRVKPVKSEATLLKIFSLIGIGPDAPFHPSTLDASTLQAINLGISDAKEQINAEFAKIKQVNGWKIIFDIWGDRDRMAGRYTSRSFAALVGLFGNPAEEAVYPLTDVDHIGQPLNGAANQYILTFPAGAWPPVKFLGFWSLTLYDENGFLVKNSMNRYSIGSLGKEYTVNPDGSLSIYIQSAAPLGDRMGNWLPAPQGLFHLVLRIYLPQDAVLNGQWTPPAVVKVH
jgi:hypothetical protein